MHRVAGVAGERVHRSWPAGGGVTLTVAAASGEPTTTLTLRQAPSIAAPPFEPVDAAAGWAAYTRAMEATHPKLPPGHRATREQGLSRPRRHEGDLATDSRTPSRRAAGGGAGDLGTSEQRTGAVRRNPAVLISGGPQAAAHLTDREIDVLVLLVDGWSNKDIANHLGIGEDTVTTHVRRIFDEFGATKRVEAVTTSVVLGVIHLSDARRARDA